MLVVLAGNLLTRGGEGEMGDFMVLFWVCFMLERERWVILWCFGCVLWWREREKRRSLTAGGGRGRWM